MSNTNMIELRKISKTYRSKTGGEVKAVVDVTLEVPERQFLTIVGPSGSGKTTLLNLIGGLDKPTAGKVIVDGVNITDLREHELVRFRRKKVGFVFQIFNLIQTLTAIENVETALAPTGMSKKKSNQRANMLLGLVGLKRQTNSLPGELSSGEQQRVAIARAFANKPNILLLDEPTGNLDTATGKEIIRLCHKISHEQNQTVVAVTHAGYVKEYTDRLLYMRDGKLHTTSQSIA